jgi:hypothetical protein
MLGELSRGIRALHRLSLNKRLGTHAAKTPSNTKDSTWMQHCIENTLHKNTRRMTWISYIYVEGRRASFSGHGRHAMQSPRNLHHRLLQADLVSCILSSRLTIIYTSTCIFSIYASKTCTGNDKMHTIFPHAMLQPQLQTLCKQNSPSLRRRRSRCTTRL